MTWTRLSARTALPGLPGKDLPPCSAARCRATSVTRPWESPVTRHCWLPVCPTRAGRLRGCWRSRQRARQRDDLGPVRGGEHWRAPCSRGILQRGQPPGSEPAAFLELVPGGAPVKKSASQYKTLPATVRPKDRAGKTRRRMAAEELADLERLDATLKAMKSELKAAVQARGSHLMDIHGIGPAGAARIIQAGTRCTSPVHRTDRRVAAAGPAARTAAPSADWGRRGAWDLGPTRIGSIGPSRPGQPAVSWSGPRAMRRR